eukprot:5633224-Prymnesium_polylepis.1
MDGRTHSEAGGRVGVRSEEEDGRRQGGGRGWDAGVVVDAGGAAEGDVESGGGTWGRESRVGLQRLRLWREKRRQ